MVGGTVQSCGEGNPRVFGWLNLKLPKETFHGPNTYGREPTSLALNFRPSIAWSKSVHFQ